MSSNPFDYVKSINSKDYIDAIDNKEYNQYIIAKAYSYFPDTILLVNELNAFRDIDSRWHYDFLYYVISKKNRYSKWFKHTKQENIDIIRDYYECRYERAIEIDKILTEPQIDKLRNRIQKGGKE